MPLVLVYSPAAADDLQSIYNYIAPESPAAADQFVRDIEARCEGLSRTPHIGVSRSDLREGLRAFSWKRRVVIIYRITDQHLEILRIFYGGRDYEAIMGGD